MELKSTEKKVTPDVYGYGCGDDCYVYFPRVDGEGCSWKWTDETWPLW